VTRIVLAWARLLRLSLAPTAIADVWMGRGVAGGSFEPIWVTTLLTIASLCLYHGGMALNDAVDVPQDKAQRADRPIPSGAISRSAAYGVAYGLLIIGVGIASLVSWRLGVLSPALIALTLALCVMAYNSPLKRSALGPVLMGSCRGLNVLLGMSAALTPEIATAVAPGIIAYIAGVTWFARDEAVANAGSRRMLVVAALLAMIGIGWLATAPWIINTNQPIAEPNGWWLLWGVVALMIGRGFTAACWTPSPRTVQRAIGIALQGVIIIDHDVAQARNSNDLTLPIRE
jgi:hypothetical protein